MTPPNSPGDPVDSFLSDMLSEGSDMEQLANLASLLPAITPPPLVRQQLLKTASLSRRLYRFAAEVARLLDVSTACAERLLDGVDENENWQVGFADGLSLYHISGGEAVKDAITGFVKVARNMNFPEHRHLGDEYAMVLQGSFRDSASGLVHRPGAICHMPVDTSHELKVMRGPALVHLVVIFGGVDVGGTVLRPGDPRI